MKFFKLVIAALLFGSLNFAAHANSLKQGDLDFAFGSDSVKTIGLGNDLSINQFAALSNQEMIETEGELWPLVYGALWLGARATIYVAPRIASTTFRRVGTRNAPVLLRNNNHFLQTGGLGTNGGRNVSSHIGWGRAANGNVSRNHIYLNRPWSRNPY